MQTARLGELLRGIRMLPYKPSLFVVFVQILGAEPEKLSLLRLRQVCSWYKFMTKPTLSSMLLLSEVDVGHRSKTDVSQARVAAGRASRAWASLADTSSQGGKASRSIYTLQQLATMLHFSQSTTDCNTVCLATSTSQASQFRPQRSCAPWKASCCEPVCVKLFVIS